MSRPAKPAAPLPDDLVPGVAAPPSRRTPIVKVVLFALGVAVLVGGAGYAVYRLRKPAAPAPSPSTVPEVASIRAASLRLPETPPVPAPVPAPAAPVASAPPMMVPAIPTQTAAPIPLRDGTAAKRTVAPEDAPIFAGTAPTAYSTAGSAGVRTATADAEASLEAQQRRLEATLQQIQGGGRPVVPGAPTEAPGAALMASGSAASPLFGSLERSATPRVAARRIGNAGLVVPKGTLFTCALKTKVITSASGFVGCQLLRHVYGDDGKVVLAERGSHLDGEYRIVQVRPGVTRVPVLWTRLRTPAGVSVELDSPATGELGESGLGGYVDNRWGERIGAALLLSLIDDAIKIAVSDADTPGRSGNTVVLPGTAAQGSKLAEQVLSATINIPPLIVRNQGEVVGVYVARDLDFSTVYELRAP